MFSTPCARLRVPREVNDNARNRRAVSAIGEKSRIPGDYRRDDLRGNAMLGESRELRAEDSNFASRWHRALRAIARRRSGEIKFIGANSEPRGLINATRDTCVNPSAPKWRSFVIP